jgi:nitroimidazol reductase NimA-like FMN-containing flavoprotein (pyridoxamine 5'-phosphate oxidase superfamily)
MLDGDRPYIVPMNYGINCTDDQFKFYFHCARAGRKVEALRQNPSVCIEVDSDHNLTGAGDIACEYGFAYRSFIGEGTAHFIETDDGKRAALDFIMLQQTGKSGFQYDEQSLNSVLVFEVELTSYSAKARPLTRP